jgi:hypothetical protein
MSWSWVVFLLIGGAAGWVAKAVVGRMIEEEPATRLGRIPFAILSLAAARLPRDLRNHLAAEWRTELQFILRKTDGRPLTRLRRGSRYAIGLLISAPAVADGLRGDTRRALHATRLIGAAAAISCAAWVSILSYDCLSVTGPVYYYPVAPVSVGGTLAAPTLGIRHLASTAAMLAASDAAGAAALLCLAAWLATTRRPLLYLAGATCVAAEILHFLGGGSIVYFWVAAGVFCIVFAIAAHQLSGRPARDSVPGPLSE